MNFPHIDDLGYYWVNPTVFITAPEECFVCGNKTPYLDVCYEAHFCDSAECNAQIIESCEKAGPIVTLKDLKDWMEE